MKKKLPPPRPFENPTPHKRKKKKRIRLQMRRTSLPKWTVDWIWLESPNWTTVRKYYKLSDAKKGMKEALGKRLFLGGGDIEYRIHPDDLEK